LRTFEPVLVSPVKERCSSLEALNRHCYATTPLRVKEEDRHTFEQEEEGEEELESRVREPPKSCAVPYTLRLRTRSPSVANKKWSTTDTTDEEDELYSSSSEAEVAPAPAPVPVPVPAPAPAPAPPGATQDLPCPGISGQDDADIREELIKLLEIAEGTGSNAREQGLEKISKNVTGDRRYKCTECGKKGRRDRLLAHVLYKHLHLKTWGCPLCPREYTTRDDLTQHLKAVKVDCVCHKSITKTNWYEHSRNCEAYLALEPGVDGEPKIQNGRITQNAPARAGPSGLNRSRSLRNQNASVKEARAARRRKLPVRRPRTARSRKYKVDDDSENEEERQSKRIKHN